MRKNCFLKALIKNWPEYYYKWTSIFDYECYSAFGYNVYDSKWQEAYGWGKNLEQFTCYGMLSGGGFPGYPYIVSILLVIFALIYLVGKLFRKDAISTIGKCALLTEITLIIIVFCMWGLVVLILYNGLPM